MSAAAGSLLMLLLDQFRELDDVGCFKRDHQAWGWGDSIPRFLGYGTDWETRPDRQPSPTYTALSVEAIGAVWPSLTSAGLNGPFEPAVMGLHQLLNRQSSNGRVDWIRGAMTIKKHEITGTIRHTSLAALAFGRYSARSTHLAEKSLLSFSSVLAQLDNSPFVDMADDLIPVSIGAIRRLLWAVAGGEVLPDAADRALKAIAKYDRVLCQAVLGQYERSTLKRWKGRPSWLQLATPEWWPDRPDGPDSVPFGVMEFLEWSPITNEYCHELLGELAAQARTRETPTGLDVYNRAPTDVASLASVAAALLTPCAESYKHSETLTQARALGARYAKEAALAFWVPSAQHMGSTQGWLWTLNTLMLCGRVRETLGALDPGMVDHEVVQLRQGSPKLYFAVTEQVLSAVQASAEGLLG